MTSLDELAATADLGQNHSILIIQPMIALGLYDVIGLNTTRGMAILCSDDQYFSDNNIIPLNRDDVTSDINSIATILLSSEIVDIALEKKSEFGRKAVNVYLTYTLG